MSKQITKETLFEAFDSKSPNIKIQNLLNALNQYVRHENNLPHIVNNMVDYLNEKKDTSIKTIAIAWMRELNKVLGGTHLWEQAQGKRRIATHTLPTSGVLDLVKYHYTKGTKMEVPELTESTFMERELTEQEKINLRMAKARAAKKRKAEERKRKQLEEERQQRLVKEAETKTIIYNNEEQELDQAEISEIEFLKNLNF